MAERKTPTKMPAGSRKPASLASWHPTDEEAALLLQLLMQAPEHQPRAPQQPGPLDWLMRLFGRGAGAP